MRAAGEERGGHVGHAQAAPGAGGVGLARPPASNSSAHTRWVGVCTSIFSPKRGSVRTVRSVMPIWARADTAFTRPNSGSSAVITYTP